MHHADHPTYHTGTLDPETDRVTWPVRPRPRKFHIPKMPRWFLFLDLILYLMLGMFLLASCAGIQSNRRITDRKQQHAGTRIDAAEGATVYSLTFQSMKDNKTLHWAGLFVLSALGWLRAWLHGRRGRLGGLRMIDTMHEALHCSNVDRVGHTLDVVKRIKILGVDKYGYQDFTERWIRSLVKKNRRRRQRRADRLAGLGPRWPFSIRWPWVRKAGDG